MLDLPFKLSERFLCEVIIHRDHLDLDRLRNSYFDLGDEVAFLLCEHNKITSIAADALSRLEGVLLPNRWRDSYVLVETRIFEYMNELDRVASLLWAQGIPMVALKNSGITRSLYCHLGASPMGDVDVLVRKADFRSAHEVLVSNGYVMKFRSPLEQENLNSAEQQGGSEYLITLPSGRHLWFELQWRPVAGRWIRPDQEPSSDDLMARSLPIEGSEARLLAPEDNLLQVALHTAKHTYVRAPGFRLHTDVDRIVRTCEIDWDRFLEMVHSLQVKTAVYLSLALANDLLRTPIPTRVLENIAPPQWKVRLMVHWLLRVGLFDPDGKKWGRTGYLIFVAFIYDDVSGLWRGIFPKSHDMANQYGTFNKGKILFFHIKRLVHLILRRTLVK